MGWFPSTYVEEGEEWAAQRSRTRERKRREKSRRTESEKGQAIGRSLCVVFVYPWGCARGLIDEGLSLREQIIKHNPRPHLKRPFRRLDGVLRVNRGLRRIAGIGLRLCHELFQFVCSWGNMFVLTLPESSLPALLLMTPPPVSALPRRCSHTWPTIPSSYSSPIKIIAPCHVGCDNWLLSLPCFYPTKSHLFSDLHFKGRTGCFVRRTFISGDTLWACHTLFIWFARYCIVGEMRSETLTGNKRDRGDRPVNSFFSRGPRPRKHCHPIQKRSC